jgi:hypothetical protein
MLNWLFGKKEHKAAPQKNTEKSIPRETPINSEIAIEKSSQKNDINSKSIAALSPFEKDHKYALKGFGNGFVVVRLADNQNLSWQTLPRRDGLEALEVSGTQHRLKNIQDNSFQLGQPLSLVPEPDNPYDENAIAVFNADKTLQAGYIPKDQTKRLLKKINKMDYGCVVMWEKINSGKRKNMRILIVEEGASIFGLEFS